MSSRSPECRAVVRLLLPSALFDQPKSSSSSWSSWKINDFRLAGWRFESRLRQSLYFNFAFFLFEVETAKNF